MCRGLRVFAFIFASTLLISCQNGQNTEGNGFKSIVMFTALANFVKVVKLSVKAHHNGEDSWKSKSFVPIS